jgi:tRNA(Ile)-lysidine synthase
MSLTLAMVHINYHLRGRASDADEQFCRELAAKSGARIYVRTRRRPPRRAKSFNLQDWARRVRYELFASLADKECFDRIAVGHHFDDQVETIAAGLFGGRDSFALTGIPRVRGRVMRPLFDCRRVEILDFLQRIGQPHREDASNRDTRYLRNLVRQKILPELRQEYNPHIDQTLFRWAGLVAEQSAFLAETAGRWVDRSIIGRGNQWLGLGLKRLRRCDFRLDYHILLEITRRLEIDKPVLGAATVRRFRHLVSSGQPGQRLSWGTGTIELSRTAVMFYLRDPGSPAPVEIDLDGATTADRWGMRIVCRLRARKANSAIRLPRGVWRFYGDAASISPPVVLRRPKTGEKIRPLGMAGRRKISDILSEAGIPRILRLRAPVFADRRGIFWVVGRRQDDRVKIHDGTREILKIEIEDTRRADERLGRTGSCQDAR